MYVQRKVKFPSEFDALDLVTDDLKTKLSPVSRKLKEYEKEIAEIKAEMKGQFFSFLFGLGDAPLTKIKHRKRSEGHQASGGPQERD